MGGGKHTRDGSLILTNEWLEERLIELIDRLFRLKNRTVIGSSWI